MKNLNETKVVFDNVSDVVISILETPEDRGIVEFMTRKKIIAPPRYSLIYLSTLLSRYYSYSLLLALA